MKVDLELISAALDQVLRNNRATATDAIPLKSLVEHWESIRLRSHDLAAGIEALYARGSIGLESRGDGLWIRHRGIRPRPANDSPYERLRSSVRDLSLHIALSRVQQRQPDGYCGLDRRLSQRKA